MPQTGNKIEYRQSVTRKHDRKREVVHEITETTTTAQLCVTVGLRCLLDSVG